MNGARRSITDMDYVASGSVTVRTKVCGNPNCRCAQDTADRHGPYHEWHRYQDGRLTHRAITSQQAAFLEKAVANHREILRLLAQWEAETIVEVFDDLTPKSRKPPK